jgi:hypothetical protein
VSLTSVGTCHLIEDRTRFQVLLWLLPFQGAIALAKSSAQLSFQFFELRLFVADDRQLLLYEIPHFDARVRVPVLDGKKFTYLSERKSQGLGSFHKCQAIDRDFLEFPISG